MCSAAFGAQRIEIVAADPALHFGKRAAISSASRRRCSAGRAPARRSGELGAAGRRGRPRPGRNAPGVPSASSASIDSDVVAHDAVAERARAAGIVAGHAADGGARGGRDVDREPQAVRLAAGGSARRARCRARPMQRAAADVELDRSAFRCFEQSMTSDAFDGLARTARCRRRAAARGTPSSRAIAMRRARPPRRCAARPRRAARSGRARRRSRSGRGSKRSNSTSPVDLAPAAGARARACSCAAVMPVGAAGHRRACWTHDLAVRHSIGRQCRGAVRGAARYASASLTRGDPHVQNSPAPRRPPFPADPRADPGAGPHPARHGHAGHRPPRARVQRAGPAACSPASRPSSRRRARWSSIRRPAPAPGRRRSSTRCRPATRC